jgi:hypothetical protein
MSELVLIRALAQLQSFRDRLVVVGGTAHRLFAMHELGTAPPVAAVPRRRSSKARSMPFLPMRKPGRCSRGSSPTSDSATAAT